MISKDKLEETIKKKLSFTASAELHDKMLNDVLNAQEQIKEKQSAFTLPYIRRFIMKSPITKLAAAAMIIVGVTLSVIIWDKTTSKAYALEQTIQASHSVRYLGES